MNPIASRHLEKALKYEKNGRTADAIDHYQKAIKSAPRWSVPWYNLGLLHKYHCNWEQSLRCNQKAAALDPKDEAAWWNLGIAATALGDWAEARRAWKTFGVPISEGDGPIEEDFGITPIRLNPDDGGEVVWCKRIDPARAIIRNIPFPESGHRYGDLVLHDGAPVGHRKLNGRDVPVFNALELLIPSEFGTYTVTVDGATSEEVEVLVELASEKKLFAEDWSQIRVICKVCSEGHPPELKHEHDRDPKPDRLVTFAAHSEDEVREMLRRWQEKTPNAEIVEVECSLEPAFVN